MAQVESTGVRVVGATGGFKGVLRAGACVAGALALAEAPAATAPVDAAACQIVRLSDIGWTDVTSTTAIFSALLRHLGYRPQTPVL